MGDRVAGAEAARALLAGDRELRKRIVGYALTLTRDPHDATDLAQSAIAKVIDPNVSPWDPTTQPNLFLHVGSVMNSLVANARRAQKRHPLESYEAQADDARPHPSGTLSAPAPDDDEDIRRLQGWMDDLLARLEGDDIATGKIRLHYEGVVDASGQAARLGCKVKDIYLANERIAYHVDIIRKAARARNGVSRPPVAKSPSRSSAEPEVEG
jgi:DNA-directed RNA polymerase specialized sigma24 family protein